MLRTGWGEEGQGEGADSAPSGKQEHKSHPQGASSLARETETEKTSHQLERGKHRTPRTALTLPVALRTPAPLAPQPLLSQAPSEPFLSLLLPIRPVSYIPSSLHCSTQHRVFHPAGAPMTFLQ